MLAAHQQHDGGVHSRVSVPGMSVDGDDWTCGGTNDGIRHCWKWPAIDSAQFASSDCGTIMCQLTMRVPADEGVKRKFMAHLTSSPASIASPSAAAMLTELSSDLIVAVTYSPSRRLHARLLHNKKSKSAGQKRVLVVEVWRQETLLQSIDVSEKHGQFAVQDEAFGNYIAWSPDETMLAYVAEHLPQTNTVSGDQRSDWGRFEYKQDWGERMIGRHSTVACVISNLQSGLEPSIKPISSPFGSSISQLAFGPSISGGSLNWSLICRLFNESVGRKYGVVYCHNRPSAIYQVDLSVEARSSAEGWKHLSLITETARSPMIRGKSLYYLSNNLGGAHNGCAKLIKYCFDSGESKVLVDQVQQPLCSSEFPGLYLDTLIAGGSSVSTESDTDYLYVTSQWRSKKRLLQIDTITGQVRPLSIPQYDGSMVLLDCSSDQQHLLLLHSSPSNPGSLVLYDISYPNPRTSLLWAPWSTYPIATMCKSIKWQILQFDTAEGLPIDVLEIQPTGLSVPNNGKLLVMPHGGPHSAFAAEWSRQLAAFCLLGFRILAVNYTGSIGYGQRFVDYLTGKIGQLDVDQCHFVCQFLRNPADKVIAYGGSHGGFISAHLITKYSDYYSAAIMRNPVLNLATIGVLSDIPDWALSESGIDYDFHKPILIGADMKVTERQWSMSPSRLIDRVEVPILFLLGAQDRRVPNYEALNWTYYIRAKRGNDAAIRVLMFPEDGHALDSVDAEWYSVQASVDFLRNLV